MNAVSMLLYVDRLGTLRPDLDLTDGRSAWLHSDELAFLGKNAAAWRALATAAASCADALEARAAQDPAAADGVARITGASS